MFFVDKRLGIEVVSSWSQQTLQLFNGGDERQVVCADEDAFCCSVMTRRIIVLTIFGEPNLHGAYKAQRIDNVESISRSCLSSSDRDEVAWEEVVIGRDARNS